jgi:recombination protein RecR
MNFLPRPITIAIEALSDLPGIGSRSAERLIFFLLKNENGLDQKIANALLDLKKSVKECSICGHFCEDEICEICNDQSRDDSVICVIETALDLIALERTGEYRGRYHVLGGVISPLNKVRPDDLRIPDFFDRIKNNTEIKEIIIATGGNIESDATALYLSGNLSNFFTGKISRLARGIPHGGDLDYLDAGTISRAILERRIF